MLAGGYASGGKDHYDRDHVLFHFIQNVIDLRGSIGWEAPISIGEFVAGRHTVFARGFGRRPIEAVYSATYELVLDIPTTLLIEVDDPQGDDRGPTGDYLYPKDITFNTQMDLRKATLYQVGRMLRMEIQMNNLTDTWSPANGFDHVTFLIPLDVLETDDLSGWTIFTKVPV